VRWLASCRVSWSGIHLSLYLSIHPSLYVCMYVRIHYGMLYAIYPCIYVLFGYLSICYLAIYLYIIWNAVGKGSVCYGLRARSAALAPAHLCSSACAPLTPLKHKTLQHAHDRDLDGTPATEPASWKPHAAPGKQVSPSVAAPIDDGQVHWGWIGGIAASEDKGLWPQRASQDEDAGDVARPIEMLQVDQSAVWGGRGGRGASGRGAWQERRRGQGTGQAGAVDDFVLFGRSIGFSQAAVELQVSFALLL